MISSLSLLAGCAGLALLIRRLEPWRPWRTLPGQPAVPETARVSLIIPARDEAANLAACLTSLQAQGPCALEILIVDDASTDATAAIAADFASRDPRLRLISAPPKPPGWVGKTWACQQGAEAARGEYLLFSDADTQHHPQSLSKALHELENRGLGLLSVIPYHAGGSPWEALMGPLQLIALAVTAPFAAPQPRRLFAIGQYLLFSRATYQALGGHAAVKGALAEDLHFARLCLQAGQAYGVSRQRLYEVRMYASPRAFLAGWRRLTNLGIEFSHPLAFGEVLLYYLAFSGGGAFGTGPASLLLMLLTIGLTLLMQSRLGAFSAIGPLLFPIALLTFALATALGLIDRFVLRRISWRGRSYPVGVPKEVA